MAPQAARRSGMPEAADAAVMKDAADAAVMQDAADAAAMSEAGPAGRDDCAADAMPDAAAPDMHAPAPPAGPPELLLDSRGCVAEAAPALGAALGTVSGFRAGESFLSILAPKSRSLARHDLERCSSGVADRLRTVLSFPAAGGGEVQRAAEFRALHDAEGRFTGLRILLPDLPAEIAADWSGERAVAETQLSLALRAAGIGAWRHDMADDRLLLDRRAQRIFRYDDAAAAELTFSQHLEICEIQTPEGDDIPALRDYVGHHARIRDDDPEIRIVKTRFADGEFGWIRVGARMTAVQARGGGALNIGTVEDITADMNAYLGRWRAQRDAEARERMMNASTRLSDIGLWSLDPLNGCCWLSPSWFTALGYEPDSMAHDCSTLTALMHPEDVDGMRAAMAAAMSGAAPGFRADFRLRAKDGRWIWFGARGQLLEQEDGTRLLCGSQININDRVEAQERLAESARAAARAMERLRGLTENVPGAIFELSAPPGAGPGDAVRLVYATPSLHELFGRRRRREAERFDALLDQIHPEDRAALDRDLAEAMALPRAWSVTARALHPERGVIWLRIAAAPRAEEDGSTAWHGNAFDVTEEVLARQELERVRAENERKALHDPLTGLPNRRYFDRVMREKENDRDADQKIHTLVRIDLDHFKMVNDTLGHAAGDAVLQHVAEILRATLRRGDFAARIGGDEFVVSMEADGRLCDGLEGARGLVGRMQAKMAEPFAFDGRPCRFGASFGIAAQLGMAQGAETLLGYADAALYEAKEAGRGRVHFFTPALREELDRLRRRSDELQEALESSRFEPYFQPQIDAATGALAGFEVLARWVHPEEGLLLPAEFIPVAERLRLVPEVDRMMVERALEVQEALAAEGLEIPRLSFNVSTARSIDPALVAAARQLQARGVGVVFELLESVLIEDGGMVFEHNMDMLRDAGIEIEVDDFGSGHASVIGVMKVQPHALKIDGRLVRPATEDPRAERLVRAMLEIARALDIKVVAEGIETEKHARLLARMGCDVLQGFHFARPMGLEALRVYLRGLRDLSREAG